MVRLALPFKRFGQRSLAAAADSEAGASGTVVYGGQIRAEYLSALQGRAGTTVYDQMRRSDAQVAMLLRAIKLPILKCDWSVEPSEEDPDKGEQIAAVVERNLLKGGLNRPWTNVLSEAMLMMPFGFSPMEKVWEFRERTPELAKLGAPEKMVWLKKMALRHPATVYSWRGLDSGQLEGIEQSVLSGPKQNPFVPIEKLVVFINDREGDNWEGISILRPAYKHWWIKEQLEKIDAAGHERMSIGIPVAGIDATVANVDATADAWEEILSNLQAMERNYIVEMPGTKFRFEVVGSGNAGLLASMNYHARMISVAGLIQFMELGNTQSGSRAVATEQSGPFLLELMATLTNVCETVDQFVIHEMVDLNFGERPGYPTLVASGLTEESTTELATFLKTLVDSRVIVPDEGLEKYVRELSKLPAAEPETARQPAPAAPGFVIKNRPETEVEGWPSEADAVAWQIPYSEKRFAMSPQEWEDAYKKGEAHWADDMQPSLFAQEFVTELRARGLTNVLEIGCGNGRDAIFMTLAGCNVTAIDIAPSALDLATEAAKAQNVKVDFRVMNAEALAFPDQMFMGVYSLSVLHCTDVSVSFAEAARVLGHGGLFLVHLYGKTILADETETVNVDPDQFITALKAAGLKLLDYYSEEEEQFDAAGERHTVLVALATKP